MDRKSRAKTARNYARAFIEALTKPVGTSSAQMLDLGAARLGQAFLEGLAECLEDSTELVSVMRSPDVRSDDKLSLAKQVAVLVLEELTVENADSSASADYIADYRKDQLSQAAGSKVDWRQLCVSFAVIVAGNGRFELIPELLHCYRELYLNLVEQFRVEILSAKELDLDQRDAIQRAVQQAMGRDAQLSFRVDPGLLGGLIFRCGDLELDSSVLGKLLKVKAELLAA